MCHAPEMEDGAVMGEMGDGRWAMGCGMQGRGVEKQEGESEGSVGWGMR